jgi:signal transduction histidine kinase
MSDPESVEFASRWAKWLLERNRRGTRPAIWVTLLFYPAFGILDYLLAPKTALVWLFSTRALVTAAALAMIWIVRGRLFSAHPHLFSSIFVLLASFGISLMTVFMGGLASPYYAGLTLTIIAGGLLYVWPPGVVLATNTLMIALFIISNLVASRAFPIAAVSNLFFLVTIAIFTSIGQILTFHSQREQVRNQIVVELTKANLERTHEQLKKLDRFKSQFFANITHELKTPLTMILSPLELMLQGELGILTDGQRSTLHSMFRNGVKLLKMVDDLLDLSKLEESRLRLKIAEHDLVEYLRGLVSQVQPLAQRKKIQLVFESKVDHALVWCDLDRMERVFVNLLANATKFANTGGHIWVTLADHEGERVRIQVRDDGPGFPAEMNERVFERFFQVNMAGTRKFGGAGIGLALAKELIQLHQGRIWAEGSPGQGAVFTVELSKGRTHFAEEVLDRRAQRRDRPGGNREADRGVADWALALEQRQDFRLLDIDEGTEFRVVERDTPNVHTHTVLVVEDTPDVTRVIHLALRQDFEVCAAPNGIKGLELALQRSPSLIITDFMMPEMDGLELTRRVRANPQISHVPIVMLTAKSDHEDRLAGIETGVNAYLTKPFSAKELLTTVRSLLNLQASTADLVLNRKMDSLETIAGGLAHEINNPLNYVQNALRSIKKDGDEILESVRRSGLETDRVQRLAVRMSKMFETAQSGVKRIGATVELMGRYSREGYSRDLVEYNAFDAIKDVIALVVPATGRDVKVETHFEGEGWVKCVPQEMHQVLTNLVQNAVEATPSEGGLIRLSGNSSDDTVELRVIDNGAGIKPEDQSKIFAPFFSTKGPGRGMGMGLTIVWRVINSLNGTISVRSQPGKGAEFIISIPRAKGSLQSHVSAVTN